MTFEITSLSTLEILDSIAHPTLEVGIQLAGGTRAKASAPTGRPAPWSQTSPLPDQIAPHFDGNGSSANERIKQEIGSVLLGRTWSGLAEVDQALAGLCADPTTTQLGRSTAIGVSMALARALARDAGKPLYAWLPSAGQLRRLPVPLFSALAGNSDSPQHLAFANILICPLGASNLKDAMRAGTQVYWAVQRRLKRNGLAFGLSDDGGFWCTLAKPEIALRLVVNAIHDAGYEIGSRGVAIAVDVDASALHRSDGAYQVGNETLSAADMVSWYTELVDAFPIWSIEDGLAADDTAGWQALTAALGDRVQLVGDQVTRVQPERIRRAKDTKVANAMAIRLDQATTVSQVLEAMRLCTEVGFAQVATQSWSETGDSFLADLAVASGCGQMAAGGPARGERVVKYNRLLQIAAHIPGLPFGRA